ncbi:MAG: type II toxin-antitoxin system Phd/YefM family antitoxin [Methylococcaceae bacterium]|nr:type II toxin-antitoxin system Phd/YefM family antitoxin [Methylococcaceae bacterium]
MYQINIHQAKTQLSKLVEEAANGEEIIIAKAGKPMAKLIPFEKTEHKPRTPGGMKGQIWMAHDFDEPMSPEELALWYDSPIFPSNE